ncbi:MAG: hypothetical protein FJ293_04725 [Planctomycetes bacterium]|nr:hypothetical protein [Planctomycetota bacterium]
MEANAAFAGTDGSREPTRGGPTATDSERAEQLLLKHRPLLCDAAREFLRRHRAVPLAALVLDTNDEEARAIAGERLPPGSRLSVAIVQPRALLAPLLRRHSAARWNLRDDDPPGPLRPLPILVITRAAIRFDVAWYPVAA